MGGRESAAEHRGSAQDAMRPGIAAKEAANLRQRSSARPQAAAGNHNRARSTVCGSTRSAKRSEQKPTHVSPEINHSASLLTMTYEAGRVPKHYSHETRVRARSDSNSSVTNCGYE